LLLIMAKSKFKPLSFSTTMRNPERIGKFLNCVLPYENQILTNDVINGIIYNIISKKIYITNYEKIKYKGINEEDDIILSREEVHDILINSPQKHKEAGFESGWSSRFATWFSFSQELGFITYEMNKPITISQTGHMLIDALNEETPNNEKIANIFLNAMIKYHTNNPYKKNLNSNIPLVLLLNVLKLLKEDQEENGAGVFRKELSLFICWPDDDANKLYQTIKEIRKVYHYSYSDDFMYEKCLNILNSDNTVYFKKEKICGEAIDEYIRKMRITGIISLRGNGRFLDFNNLEIEKINYILENYKNVKSFESKEEYSNYIGQIDNNILEIETNPKIDIRTLRLKKLNEIADTYSKETINNELRIVCKKRYSSDPLFKYIDEPARLEFLTSVALIQNFTGLQVEPNYVIDDEGLPTSTAGGGVPDILCRDTEYDNLVEVTLMCGRSDQVNNEIIPIRRHLLKLRDENNKSFAIFLAPIIHEDTKESANWYKYRENLDIIPLDIEEFIYKISNLSKIYMVLE